jgi:hypothetical protein
MEGEPERQGEAAYPSLELIYELALRQLEGRLERIDALDSKLGALLGFVAVVLALLLNSDFVVGRWSWATTAGTSLLLLALLVLFLAFAARTLRRDPDLRVLRWQHVGRPIEETQFGVIDTVIDAINKNDTMIVWKSRFLNGAVFLALLGLLIVAVRLLYLLQGGGQ